jgi:DNA-binding CsgD family transcriptional regulator
MSELSTTTQNEVSAAACSKLYLTARELQCLTEITVAKSLEKAAQKLMLSQRTVYFYLANIQHKVGHLLKSVKP